MPKSRYLNLPRSGLPRSGLPHSGSPRSGTKLSGWIEKRIPKAASLSLNHKQVFILPSKAGIGFVIALALMLIAAINFENSLIYAVAFWLFSLFSINIIQTWRNLANIKLSAQGVMPIFLGERAHFNICLEGHKKDHHQIKIMTSTSYDQGSVSALSPALLTLICESDQRGYLKLPRFKIESRYPLGLAVAWSYVDLDQKALVYPYPFENTFKQENNDLDVYSDQETKATTKIGVDDFMGLRAYQAGDGINRIAWKALSKGQGLLVKQFNAQAGMDIWLNLESFEGSLEHKLSCICYWVIKFYEQQQNFGVNLGTIIIKPNSGEEHKNSVLRELALYNIKDSNYV
ncbi:hypothetical protein AwWohl_10390 [Gammaproteobacteria bacterium]|nr:hypothetical protein AwWohl_10390 [Gammaproteobacteria bacterium]